VPRLVLDHVTSRNLYLGYRETHDRIRSMNKTVLGIILVVLIVGGGILLLSGKSRTDSEKEQIQSPSLTQENDTIPPATPENYVNYSEKTVADAQEKGRTLLFFSAVWCPTCRGAEQDILRNNSDLPEDLTIVKTDYDSQTDLKEKYNVVVQHTFVQIDENGNELTKWVGGGVATINDNIVK
jgi:thioredoxin 1